MSVSQKSSYGECRKHEAKPAGYQIIASISKHNTWKTIPLWTINRNITCCQLRKGVSFPLWGVSHISTLLWISKSSPKDICLKTDFTNSISFHIVSWNNSDLKFLTYWFRVLARISKMPVQKSNYKISACPELASHLLQILFPTTFKSLLCQKGQFTLQLCPKRWLNRKIFGNYPKKSKLKILYRNLCLSRKEVFWKLSVQKTGRTGPG